jgi:hypothetical protein
MIREISYDFTLIGLVVKTATTITTSFLTGGLTGVGGF